MKFQLWAALSLRRSEYSISWIGCATEEQLEFKDAAILDLGLEPTQETATVYLTKLSADRQDSAQCGWMEKQSGSSWWVQLDVHPTLFERLSRACLQQTHECARLLLLSESDAPSNVIQLEGKALLREHVRQDTSINVDGVALTLLSGQTSQQK